MMDYRPKSVVIREQELIHFCFRIQEHAAAGYCLSADFDYPVEEFGDWYQCFMTLLPGEALPG